MARRKNNEDYCALKFKVHTPMKNVRGIPFVKIKNDYFYFNKSFSETYIDNAKKVFVHVARTEDGVVIAFEKTNAENNKAIPLAKTSSYLRVKEKVSNIFKIDDNYKEVAEKHKFRVSMVKIPFAEKVPSITICNEWSV